MKIFSNKEWKKRELLVKKIEEKIVLVELILATTKEEKEKLESELKNERHKNLLLKSKLTDFEYKAESLVKEIERLTDKYIPKHAKDGKFTGKNN